MNAKIVAILAAMLLASVTAQAAITIETVPVGDLGNAADTAVYGAGAVSYEYNIGKYEVTAGQYTAFLNAVAVTDTYGVYNTKMAGSGPTNPTVGIIRSGSSGSYSYSVDANYANRPVAYTSFWDAARFTNWLHNDQPTGAQDANTTERGAYTLDGYDGTDGSAIVREAGAKWAIPTEDEWYKAAYYKAGDANAGYWAYPTQSNTAPGHDLTDVSGNNARTYLDGSLIDGVYYTAVVGTYVNSESAYGTFDQAGNVVEWNEHLAGVVDPGYANGRLQHGGVWAAGNDKTASSVRDWFYDYANVNGSFASYGFRVVEVPEPATMSLLALAGLGLLRRRK